MKSGENGLIGPGDNNYGRDEIRRAHGYQKKNTAVVLMLEAAKEACERIIELENQMKWYSIRDKLPPLYKKVIRTDFRVDGHPEYDNQTIDYLTKDCNTGEIKWFNAGRKPSNENEYWMVLQDPPSNVK